jgi:hypothetical protein
MGGAIWVWSWYTMYLEIFRWKHVIRSLRFAPCPPSPGTDIRPKPGLPVKALFVCFFGAPLLVILGETLRWRARATGLMHTEGGLSGREQGA